MGHTLSESLFIPTMNIGSVRLRSEGNFTIGLLQSKHEHTVHYLQVGSQRLPTTELNESEPFAREIQALSLDYNNLQTLGETLEEHTQDILWSYAANSFDLEDEQSVIGVIRVIVTVLLEDERRNFLVLLFTQQLDEYIYSTTIYELVQKKLSEESEETETNLEKMIRMYIAEDENKETQILFNEGDQIPKDKDTVTLLFQILKCATVEGRQAYWEVYNDVILTTLKLSDLLGEELNIEQIYDGDRLFKVHLKSAKENERPEKLLEQQNYSAVIEDEIGIVSQVRGFTRSKWMAITAEDRGELDYDENQIYHEDPEEIIRHAEVDYIQRDSGLIFYLGISVFETSEDKVDSAVITIVYEGVELQKIELDVQNGLRINDPLEPALQALLDKHLITFPGLIARMMQNLDRTLSVVSYR